MNILIIGSNGFIGSNCVEHFLKKQCAVWQADVTPSKADRFFLLEKHNTNFEEVFKAAVFDVCINASGSANVAFSFDNPTIDFELNVVNVHKILVALRSFNSQCRFINFSSAAVYGNPEYLPICENAALKPLSPYGFHKLQSEYLLKEYFHFFGLKTCSLRIFSAYGKGLKKQLFWDLYQKYRSAGKIEIFGTGNESRDFIYIDDLLLAIDAILDKCIFEGETINVASGTETTIKDAVSIFYHYLNPDADYNFTGKIKQGDPLNWRANIDKLKRMGFLPAYTMKDGLKRYTEWLKE